MTRHLLSLLALALTACGTIEPVPEDRFYRLLVAAPDRALEAPVLAGLVEVERFVADGLVDKTQIVYSEQRAPHRLEAYHYHFWTEAPVVMIRDQLVGYLRTANAATRVVTPELRVAPDFVITGKIHRLERVVGGPFEAVIELELGLREENSDRLLLLQTYKAAVPTKGETVGDTVLALTRALDRIFARFVADLARL